MAMRVRLIVLIYKVCMHPRVFYVFHLCLKPHGFFKTERAAEQAAIIQAEGMSDGEFYRFMVEQRAIANAEAAAAAGATRLSSIRPPTQPRPLTPTPTQLNYYAY